MEILELLHLREKYRRVLIHEMSGDNKGNAHCGWHIF
jgi:hypothetical protein